jgi:hypothetical protein
MSKWQDNIAVNRSFLEYQADLSGVGAKLGHY